MNLTRRVLGLQRWHRGSCRAAALQKHLYSAGGSDRLMAKTSRSNRMNTFLASSTLMAQRRWCTSATVAGDMHALRSFLTSAEATAGEVCLCFCSNGEVALKLASRSGADAGTLAKADMKSAASLTDLLDQMRHSSTTASLPSSVQRSYVPPASSLPMLVDLSVEDSDYMNRARAILKRHYPHLKLHIEHTTGTDLCGRRTHTAEVNMQKRSEYASEHLYSSEVEVLGRFHGESIGFGYHNTFKRALKQAFDCIGLDFAEALSGQTRNSMGNSVLMQYIKALQSCCPGLSVLVQQVDQNEVGIQVTSPDRGVIYSITGNHCHTFSLLLSACESACTRINRDLAERTALYVEDHPIVLVLPDSHVRIKRTFFHLLAHYYGVVEDDVEYLCEPCDTGVRCVLKITARWVVAAGVAEKEVVCDKVVEAIGASKKVASRQACVRALQLLFPSIYEKQLKHHPEVQALASCDGANSGQVACPPTCVGFARLLDWGLRQSHRRYRLQSVQLQPHISYEEFGVVVTAPTWATQLFIYSVPDTSSGAGTHSPTEGQVGVGFHVKKSRSEMTALAFGLFQFCRDICPAGVAMAVDQKLINEEGCPLICETVKFCEPVSSTARASDSGQEKSEEEDEATAAACDVFAENLDPAVPVRELAPFCSETAEQSLMRIYRRVAAGTADLPSCVKERCSLNTMDGLYYAEIRSAVNDDDATSSVGNGVSPVEARAVMEALEEFCVHLGTAASLVGNEAHTLIEQLPISWRTDNPLNTAVRALSSIYGMGVEMQITKDKRNFLVELRAAPGAPPAISGDAFVFSKGRGFTAVAAAMQCCRQAFETHVLPVLHSYSAVNIVTEGVFTVHVHEQSRLGSLVQTIIGEINATGKAKCRGEIQLVLHSGVLSPFPYSSRLVALMEGNSVTLEEAGGPDAFRSLASLCAALETEIRTLTTAPVIDTTPSHTALQLLQKTCKNMYGLSLRHEEVLLDKDWHCRLLLPLSTDGGRAAARYCVCLAKSSKKKEALSDGASWTLQRFFQKVDAYSSLSKSARVSAGNYVFTFTD